MKAVNKAKEAAILLVSPLTIVLENGLVWPILQKKKKKIPDPNPTADLCFHFFKCTYRMNQEAFGNQLPKNPFQ